MSDEMDKLRKRLVKEAKEKGIQGKRLDAKAKVMREWRVKQGVRGLKRTIGKKATAIKKAVTTAGGTLGKAVSTGAKQTAEAARIAKIIGARQARQAEEQRTWPKTKAEIAKKHARDWRLVNSTRRDIRGANSGAKKREPGFAKEFAKDAWRRLEPIIAKEVKRKW